MEFRDRVEGARKALPEAVKALRAHFGESQQTFATRFGLSIRAIANYEKDRKPEGRVLAMFAKAASDAGRKDLIFTFMLALGNELGLSDIEGGLLNIGIGGRGYLLIQFEGTEAAQFALAFFETYAKFKNGTRDEKAAAEKLLNDFKKRAEQQGGLSK